MHRVPYVRPRNCPIGFPNEETTAMIDAFILGGVRTPVGRYAGSLSHIRTDDLLGQTMAWAGAGGPPNPNLLARDAYVDMMKTAQNVADRYELTREEIDAFALRSHQHAAAARDSGRLAEEIHAVEIPATRRQAARAFEHDESIRDDTT